jgi:hypothetical protein
MSNASCSLNKDNIMIAVYVDNFGIVTFDEQHIEDLIAGLRAQGFILHKEGNFKTFLGISIDPGISSDCCIHCLDSKGSNPKGH